MDFKEAFKDFNASKFVFFGCLLPFSILLSLQLDEDITITYWNLFTPLWLLNLIVLFGALIGGITWCHHPESRRERDGYTDFKALLITAGLHITLLMFEALVCYKAELQLESASVKSLDPNTPLWIIIFTPLFFASPIALAACIWEFKNDRSLELEAILSTNILLFVFIALRLDGYVNWDWTTVFIPLWVLMCLPSVAVLYYFSWALIFCRATYQNDRRSHLLMAIIWIFVVVPMLFFQVLLAYKLDGSSVYNWKEIFYPLHISLFALMLSSFGSKGGNRWWFGMRSEFCPFLLHHFPCLMLYGNISYTTKDEETVEAQPTYAHLYGSSTKDSSTKVVRVSKNNKYDCIVPIDTPD